MSRAQKILQDSIYQQNVGGILMGLAMGADPNGHDSSGVTPMHRAMATAAGQVLDQSISVLLDAGANPLIDDQATGESLLLKAIRQQEEGVAALLLNKGAPPSKASYAGVTPLMAAAETGSCNLCEMLLNASHGKSSMLEMRDNSGRTALMYGAQQPTVALLLLATGADPRPKDRNGMSAIDLVTDAGVKGMMLAKASYMDAQDLQRQQIQAENSDELNSLMAMTTRMTSQLLGGPLTTGLPKPRMKP